MISLTLTVSDLTTLLQIYDRIQIRRYTGTGTPSSTIDISDYTTASGNDTISSRTGVSDVLLDASYTQYYFTDPIGVPSDWYISRYYKESTGSASAWTVPVLGEAYDFYYDPLYPPEVEYDTAEQLVVDRIRLLIGDPIDLRREYGENVASSIHDDDKTLEFDEKGWPVSLTMGGTTYNQTTNPSVNGYRFLRFLDTIEATTWSGCEEIGLDIWYYTFRNSDRQIIEFYNNCPPPAPLTTTTATAEVYMIQTAIDLLRSELWEDSTEDGATIRDEGSLYNPSEGLKVRKDLLDDLTKRRDDLIKSLQLTGITGVLLD